VKALLTLITALVLTGCASTPSVPLTQLDDTDLCIGYETHRTAEFRAEIDRRKLIPAGDWSFIAMRAPYVGMGECSVHAAMGKARRVNFTSTPSGLVSQHIYYGRTIAHLRNGKVIAVQF
jgi:hypothetical protein